MSGDYLLRSLKVLIAIRSCVWWKNEKIEERFKDEECEKISLPKNELIEITIIDKT